MQSQGVDNIENPSRPPTSGKYRLKGGHGRGESFGYSSFNARVDKPKGFQQDPRTLGPESGDNYNHRRIRSELSGLPQSFGRAHDTERQKYIASSGQGGTGGTDSSEVPARRGMGTFYFGDISLPSTHQVYRSGLGWIPEDEASASALRHNVSSSGTGIGGSGDSSLVRSKVQCLLSGSPWFSPIFAFLLLLFLFSFNFIHSSIFMNTQY